MAHETEPPPLLERLTEIEEEFRGFARQFIDPPSIKERFALRVGTITEARAIVQAWSLMDELRQDEPSWVTINHNNGGFDGPHCLIEVGGDWTRYESLRFEGDSILDCLLKAQEARDKALKT